MNKITLTTFTDPMVDSGEVSIRDVKRGWFIVKEKEMI